jgi:hypothetical protein
MHFMNVVFNVHKVILTLGEKNRFLGVQTRRLARRSITSSFGVNLHLFKDFLKFWKYVHNNRRNQAGKNAQWSTP